MLYLVSIMKINFCDSRLATTSQSFNSRIDRLVILHLINPSNIFTKVYLFQVNFPLNALEDGTRNHTNIQNLYEDRHYSDILVIKWGPTYHLKNFSFPHLFLIIKSGSPAQLLFN
jgi:hypothetical protein